MYYINSNSAIGGIGTSDGFAISESHIGIQSQKFHEFEAKHARENDNTM